MNNAPHKFKPVTNGTGTYDYSVFCEYCGLIAFNANHTDNAAGQDEAKRACPRSPDPDAP